MEKKNKYFLFHTICPRNEKFLKFHVGENPLFDCGKKLSTASLLHFALRCLYLAD